MKSLFNTNGLMFWSEREIQIRNYMVSRYAQGLEGILKAENKAWEFVHFEGPQLTPMDLINPNYDHSDVWVQGAHHGFSHPELYALFDSGDYSHVPKELMEEYGSDLLILRVEYDNWLRELEMLVLRPETTPSSYVYAQHLFNSHEYKAPLCVWQVGKSFRREQDQVTKNMRLKEFYQQEFQCIYSTDTLNDYHTAVLEPVRKLIAETVCLPTRLVESDRLPDYSEITTDVEVNNGDKWMEVVSISRRTDFPETLKFQGKKGVVEKDALVLEVAIGIDRCVYNHERFIDGI